MTARKILIISAHGLHETYGAALANSYADSARSAGHKVKIIHLNALSFDPILHHGYHTPQELEPDLKMAQAAIREADHLAFFYPIWWGSVPAILKGFLDRVFLPGFAFKYHPGKKLPEKLLKGRSAHLVVTMDTPPWYFSWIFKQPGIAQMTHPTLGLCGIKTLEILKLGPIISASNTQRTAWLNATTVLARKV